MRDRCQTLHLRYNTPTHAHTHKILFFRSQINRMFRLVHISSGIYLMDNNNPEWANQIIGSIYALWFTMLPSFLASVHHLQHQRQQGDDCSNTSSATALVGEAFQQIDDLTWYLAQAISVASKLKDYQMLPSDQVCARPNHIIKAVIHPSMWVHLLSVVVMLSVATVSVCWHLVSVLPLVCMLVRQLSAFRAESHDQ